MDMKILVALLQSHKIFTLYAMFLSVVEPLFRLRNALKTYSNNSNGTIDEQHLKQRLWPM